jgi:gluconolactonase
MTADAKGLFSKRVRYEGRIVRAMVGLLASLLLSGAMMADEFVPTAQDEIVPPDARVELLWGEGEFTEGPAASPIDRRVYFSDIGNRILRYDQVRDEVAVFREPSGKANGLMFDGRGRLYACEGANGGNRRVTVTERDGSVRPLAERYQGKRFNSPNDLFVDAQLRVWFTDPRYVGDEPMELDFAGVYVILPDGTLRLATRELKRPNGILVSPSLKRLYVAESDGDPQGPHQLVAFDIAEDASLGNKQVLFDFGPNRRGIDGMTLDNEGNIYAAAGRDEHSGIYVFSPQGKPLARIPLAGAPTNCTFGLLGNTRMLYITAAVSREARKPAPGAYGLFRVALKKPGYLGFPLPRVGGANE